MTVPDDFNLLDVPGVAPDEEPLHVMSVNETWVQYIIGALENLTARSIWAGTDEEIDEVLQQVET